MTEIKIKTRGLENDDDQSFSTEKIETIKKAKTDVRYLVQRGYPTKSAITFTCNHYQLSKRQQMAIARTTAVEEIVNLRKAKEISPESLHHYNP